MNMKYACVWITDASKCLVSTATTVLFRQIVVQPTISLWNPLRAIELATITVYGVVYWHCVTGNGNVVDYTTYKIGLNSENLRHKSQWFLMLCTLFTICDEKKTFSVFDCLYSLLIYETFTLFTSVCTNQSLLHKELQLIESLLNTWLSIE